MGGGETRPWDLRTAIERPLIIIGVRPCDGNALTRSPIHRQSLAHQLGSARVAVSRTWLLHRTLHPLGPSSCNACKPLFVSAVDEPITRGLICESCRTSGNAVEADCAPGTRRVPNERRVGGESGNWNGWQ